MGLRWNISAAGPAAAAIVFALAIIIVVAAFDAWAWRGDAPVTPYGGFCPGANRYGSCGGRMSYADALKILDGYYAEKGFTVRVTDVRGRFIKAEILDKEKVVDVIIFDRRFGRIRSVY